MRIAVFLLLSVCALGVHADEYISVHATGWIEAIPDTLTLRAGAEATGKDVEALQRSADRTTSLVTEAAVELGVATEDIDTSRLSVRPNYQWREGQRIYLGQTVRREMTIVLRDIDRYGVLIQALSRFDLRDLSQPQLSHSDLDSLKLDAMEKAIDNGFRKARRIADSIGAELGPVLRVEEQGALQPSPVPRMMAAEAVSADAPIVQFGPQRISASVTMRFAIE
jgi:uncharacterized protein YggE